MELILAPIALSILIVGGVALVYAIRREDKMKPQLQIYKSRHNDRHEAISGIIAFACIVGIFLIVLFCACEHVFGTMKTEAIYKNLQTCPKSSVVDYRQGEPIVYFRGEKIKILAEGCHKYGVE